MRAVRLRTEYLKDPLGIDIVKPRLSWNCQGGKKQKAYRILAIDQEGNTAWNSGVVLSDRMHLIEWEGRRLHSRDRITWSVCLWEESENLPQDTGAGTEVIFETESAAKTNEAAGPGKNAGIEKAAGPGKNVEIEKAVGPEKNDDIEKAFFEMGLLEKEDWKASWITGNYQPAKNKRYPVDCFQKEILLEKPVKSARIYASACGLYEIRINGEKAGEFCLAPGYTDYRKRIQYQTIDVTEIMKNVWKASLPAKLTASLADGWYRGSVGAHGLLCEFGTETKLLVQLEIQYEDGRRQTIVSDDSWDWSNDGPIRFADNKDGEKVDANRCPSYCQKAKITSYEVMPSASDNVLLTENEIFKGRKFHSPSGRLLFDFGQNLAGYISFACQALKGSRLIIRLGEMLDKDGELTLKNIQTRGKKGPTPLQEYDYICKEGFNEYKTTFSISGFQYAEVTFENLSPEEERRIEDSMTMRSYAVYSRMEETGFFESSNQLLNRFVSATKWSTKSNSADIPTDCPTRERHGWTGDAQIFFETASILFDYAAFSRKYLRDVYDWQKKNGRLPQIAPYAGVDFFMQTMNGSVGWSDIGVLLPYRFYCLNGDKRILEENYEHMKSYAHFMMGRCGRWGGPYAKPTGVRGPEKKYLVTCGQSYDEWAEPQDVNAFVWTDFAAPHPEVQTAYTVHIMDHMVRIAQILGREEDIPLYRRYARGCRKAYRSLIHTNKEYSLDTDRQARLVRPLYMKLLGEEDRKFASGRLLRALENYGWRLGTGFLSTPFILKVLQKIDVSAAYHLLENEEIPGWLSMPKAGATTIWEAWEGSAAAGEVASLNHYSKGALCEWLFEEMCGIHVDGENHFRIAPVCGGSFTYAKASWQTVYGKVGSGWQKEADGHYTFTVEIPANTTADLILPGQKPIILTGGESFQRML